jgi:hypothetical protein
LLGHGAGFDPNTVRANEDLPPPRVASTARAPEPISASPRPFPPRGSVLRRGEPPADGAAAGGWWLGTAGIALALAVCGGITVALRQGWRWPQSHAGGAVRVIGRTRISPRHTVHLLSVGQRVLIVGTGAQGAPALLGELTDDDELQRLIPAADVQAQRRSVVVNARRPPGDDR